MIHTDKPAAAEIFVNEKPPAAAGFFESQQESKCENHFSDAERQQDRGFTLRPHHGLCILNFTGHGYSEEFTRHMTELIQTISAHPETMIQIAEGCDDLCAHCPNRGETDCTSALPPQLDHSVLDRTGLSAGDKLTWEQFSSLTRPINREHLQEVCDRCEWLALCLSVRSSGSSRIR